MLAAPRSSIEGVSFHYSKSSSFDSQFHDPRSHQSTPQQWKLHHLLHSVIVQREQRDTCHALLALLIRQIGVPLLWTPRKNMFNVHLNGVVSWRMKIWNPNPRTLSINLRFFHSRFNRRVSSQPPTVSFDHGRFRRSAEFDPLEKKSSDRDVEMSQQCPFEAIFDKISFRYSRILRSLPVEGCMLD